MARKPNCPVDICSHKRSGTHLLAATIWENFILPDVSVSTTIHRGKKFIIRDKEWIPGDRVTIPWGGLWRSHNFFQPSNATHKTLYIVRNPINVLISYWRLMDPLCRKDPEIYLGEERIAFWVRHATGYTNNCHWIKYEDLVGLKHDQVLEQIRRWFNLEKRHPEYKRVKYYLGWYPDKTPIQPKAPSSKLRQRLKENIPDNFLGYNIEE